MPTVLDPGAIVVCVELPDQRFHLFRLRARADQHGIRGGYYDHVVEPDHRGQNGFLRADEIVEAVQHDDRAIGCISGRIAVEHVSDRIPAADIRPTKVCAHITILMREHRLGRICTRDIDFNQFPFFGVMIPLGRRRC
jgi:hypothetical protein